VKPSTKGKRFCEYLSNRVSVLFYFRCPSYWQEGQSDTGPALPAGIKKIVAHDGYDANYMKGLE